MEMNMEDEWDYEPPQHDSRIHQCYAERRLWATVITATAVRASIGEGTAINWFRSTDGQFALLCSFMGLPETLIRAQVLRKALATLQTKHLQRKGTL